MGRALVHVQASAADIVLLYAHPTAERKPMFGMKRRKFITLIGGAAVTWPLSARAQQPERMRRIGVLLPTAADDPVFQAWVGSFLQGLALSGWTMGRNVRLETGWVKTAANIRRLGAE